MINVTEIKEKITVFDYFYSSERFKYVGKKGFEHYFAVGQEKNASVSVNPNTNFWFYHGVGIGGDVFRAIQYFEQITDFKAQAMFLQTFNYKNYSLECYSDDQQGTTITNIYDCITNANLLKYAEKRGITVHCENLKQIHFENKGKKYYALGFKNDSNGYDVRNEFFKGKIGKTDISTGRFGNGICSKVLIFEGFTDLLAYQKHNIINFEYVVLNSTANIQKAVDFLQQEGQKYYSNYYFLLDNDHAGDKATDKLKHEFPGGIDVRGNYKDSKDVAEHYLKKRA